MEWLDQINPSINEMWRGEWRSGFIEPARYLYDHELVCVLEGEFTLTIEGIAHPMEAGDFFIVPPNVHHVSETLSCKVRRACIHFDWTGRPREGRDGIVCFHPKRPERQQICATPKWIPAKATAGVFDLNGDVPRLLERLFARWEMLGGREAGLCRGLFIELVTLLFWSPHVNELTSRSRSAQLAYAAKELLDQREPGTPESIQDLFASMGFSYAHLARLFRSTFGQTPLGYYNARLLERARLTLEDPRTSVQEAATEAGFNDVSYFIRSFRRQFGKSPGEYRDGSA